MTLFDPARLRLARQAAGYRKNELAEQIGVSPAAITQYEQGQTRPRPPIVARIALALGYPAEYFVRDGRPIEPANASNAFFRSLRSTRQYEREQAAAKAVLVWEAFAAIDEHAKLPMVQLPELSLTERATSDAVEDAALALRHAWGLGLAPLPNVVRLLEVHGVVVARLHATNPRIDAFSQWLGGRPIVVLWDSKNDAARSRADAAHELAHLTFHHDPEPGNKVLEEQAQALAAAFLTPAICIADALPTRCPRGAEWDDLFEMKRAWGVSVSSLLYRAKSLGRLSAAAHRRAMIRMAERGWRTDEPGSLGQPEQPTLLRSAVELLDKDRGYGRAELARDLRLSVERIEEILGPGNVVLSQASPSRSRNSR